MCGQIVQVDKKLHVDFYLVFDLFDSSYTPGKATVQERGQKGANMPAAKSAPFTEPEWKIPGCVEELDPVAPL